MQVSVETTSGLERRMTVQVPAERIQSEVDSRLKSLSKRVKIAGFRPGKVPVNVVRQRYEGEVRQEVLGEVIQTTFSEAVVKEKLRPAGAPSVEPKDLEDDQGFAYTATFEVYPEFELADASKLKITKPTAEVADADVDKMLENLRKQRTDFEAVDRATEEEDRVTIDYKGFLDGEAFDGGEGADHPLILGSNSFIPGFEEQLVGAKKGDKLSLDLTFPEEYHSKDLAGKATKFEVEIKEVEGPKLPEIDEEFVKSFGHADGGVDGFLTEVRASMDRELKQQIKAKSKEKALDALLDANEIDVPKALVEEEIDRMMQQMTQQMGQDAQAQDLQLPREMFQDQAKRRVSLGLVLGEVISVNEIKADDKQVRSTIDEFAASYEKPEEVLNWYYSKPENLASVESMVLEDQAVEWILEQAKVTEESASYEEMMAPAAPQAETD